MPPQIKTRAIDRSVQTGILGLHLLDILWRRNNPPNVDRATVFWACLRADSSAFTKVRQKFKAYFKACVRSGNDRDVQSMCRGRPVPQFGCRSRPLVVFLRPYWRQEMNLSAFLLLFLLPLTYVQAQGKNGNGTVGQGGGNGIGNARANQLAFTRCRKGESDNVDMCDIDVPVGTAWINEDDVEVVVDGMSIRCTKTLAKYDSLGGAPGQQNWYVPIIRNVFLYSHRSRMLCVYRSCNRWCLVLWL